MRDDDWAALAMLCWVLGGVAGIVWSVQLGLRRYSAARLTSIGGGVLVLAAITLIFRGTADWGEAAPLFGAVSVWLIVTLGVGWLILRRQRNPFAKVPGLMAIGAFGLFVASIAMMPPPPPPSTAQSQVAPNEQPTVAAKRERDRPAPPQATEPPIAAGSAPVGIAPTPTPPSSGMPAGAASGQSSGPASPQPSHQPEAGPQVPITEPTPPSDKKLRKAVKTALPGGENVVSTVEGTGVEVTYDTAHSWNDEDTRSLFLIHAMYFVPRMFELLPSIAWVRLSSMDTFVDQRGWESRECAFSIAFLRPNSDNVNWKNMLATGETLPDIADAYYQHPAITRAILERRLKKR